MPQSANQMPSQPGGWAWAQESCTMPKVMRFMTECTGPRTVFHLPALSELSQVEMKRWPQSKDMKSWMTPKCKCSREHATVTNQMPSQPLSRKDRTRPKAESSTQLELGAARKTRTREQKGVELRCSFNAQSTVKRQLAEN